LFSPAAVIGPLQVEEPPGNAPTRHVHTLAILENFRGNLQAIPPWPSSAHDAVGA
jgi:hypothetical protein